MQENCLVLLLEEKVTNLLQPMTQKVVTHTILAYLLDEYTMVLEANEKKCNQKLTIQNSDLMATIVQKKVYEMKKYRDNPLNLQEITVSSYY